MDKFKNIFKYLSFTRSETKVILFIVSAIIIGFSIKYYKQVFGDTNTKNQDYFSKTDERFLSKSRNPGFDTLDNQKKEKILRTSDDSLKNAEKEKKTKSKKEIALEGKQININTASKDELMLLPGVGESIASRIIEYRELNNGFKNIEDIMEVKGIGKKKFEKMKDYIKVE